MVLRGHLQDAMAPDDGIRAVSGVLGVTVLGGYSAEAAIEVAPAGLRSIGDATVGASCLPVTRGKPKAAAGGILRRTAVHGSWIVGRPLVSSSRRVRFADNGCPGGCDPSDGTPQALDATTIATVLDKAL